MSAESLNTPSTSRCADRCELIWKIEGLTNEGMFQSPTKIIKSPIFCIPGGECGFRILLQTRPERSSVAEGYIDLTLLYVKGPDSLVHCEFSLIDETGENTFIRYFFGKLCQSGSWGCENFVTRNEMMDQKLKLINNNEVTVSCAVKALGEMATYKLCEQGTESSHSTDNGPRNILSFYDDNLAADIVLKVGRKSIVAHKALLMHRSPIFAAILKDNSIEVAIQDVESDVFAELVRYLYTNDFSRHSVGFVAKLLSAADRYDVESLKTLCIDHLKQQVVPDNVLDILKSTKLCPSEEVEKICAGVVESEIASSSLMDCMKKIKDLPQIIYLLKKRFIDDDGRDHQNKRQRSG